MPAVLSRLHVAARDGCVQRVVALLSKGWLDINQGAPDGCTPLMLGAGGGHSSIVSILLNKGADLSLVGKGGYTALLVSAEGGHLEVTTTLMEAGADLSATTTEGSTALHLASHHGHFKCARVLIKAGADIQATCSYGFTPLHAAAHQGKLEAVEELVGAGADLHAGLEQVDSAGITPLHLATQNGHLEVVLALIEAGGNFDARSSCGDTPLFWAAKEGHLEVVKVLLRAKANPLLTSTTQSSGKRSVPLDGAAQSGHTAVVKELIQHVGLEGCAGASGGMNALHLAAQEQHVGVMAVLSEAGVVDTGEALHVSAKSGDVAAVKLLLRQQRSKTVERAFKDTCNTALRCSITCGVCSPRVARLLTDAGVDMTSVSPACGAIRKETILDTTIRMLRKKNFFCKEAMEQKVPGLEGIRRLLLRVEAVHAISWLWFSDAPNIGNASKGSRMASTASTPLRMMVPAMGRRARRRCGVLLRALFRYSSKSTRGGPGTGALRDI